MKFSSNTAQDSTRIRNLLVKCIWDVSYFCYCWSNCVIAEKNNKATCTESPHIQRRLWKQHKNSIQIFSAWTEEQTIVDLKWKIERGKHLTLLPHVCGHNASFALTSACGHVALFVQLIMHVDHCTLSAERKVWEVRLLEKVVQDDVWEWLKTVSEDVMLLLTTFIFCEKTSLYLLLFPLWQFQTLSFPHGQRWDLWSNCQHLLLALGVHCCVQVQEALRKWCSGLNEVKLDTHFCSESTGSLLKVVPGQIVFLLSSWR